MKKYAGLFALTLFIFVISSYQLPLTGKLLPPEACADDCGYIDSSENNDRICISSLRYACNVDSVYGTIRNACDKFDALCLQNSYFSTWSECDAFGDTEKSGSNGITDTKGEKHTINGHELICMPVNNYYESWVQCGGSLQGDGILKQQGETITDGTTIYYCCNDKWQAAPCAAELRCGSACSILESGALKSIGIYDKLDICLEIRDYYSEKHCCMNKDCPAEQDCGSDGKCKPVNRLGCESQGINYVCMARNECKADLDAVVVYGYCQKSGESCCFMSPSVQQELDSILITPSAATIQAGQEHQFAAQAYDTNGNTIYGLAYSWSAPSEIGTIDNGLLTANAIGSGAITASATLNGVTKEATASIIVEANLCTPGLLKTGAECLVCNADGTGYVQDNSKCTTEMCQSDGRCKTAVTSQIKIAAIKMSVPGPYGEIESSDVTNLINKINKVLADHPDVDLIITPEYSLYDTKKPVELKQTSSEYGVLSSNIIVDGINRVINIAKANNVNVVLGTFREKTTTGGFLGFFGTDVFYNSQLIISGEGKIIGIKRKTTGSDWSDCSGKTCDPAARNAAYRVALDTTKFFALKAHSGEEFTILPTICAERNNIDMIERARNYNVDFVVASEREGDASFEIIAQQIQNDEPVDSSWDWAIREVYIDEYLSRNVVKDVGYLVVSDSARPQGGIISFQKNKLLDLSITGDYVFGIVPLSPSQTCSDSTHYGSCSSAKPKYCDNGNLIDKCSICGCVSGTCRADGICRIMSAITGAVRDASNNPVKDAIVLIVDSSGRKVGDFITDADGNYRFSDIPPGTYQIILGRHCYKTQKETIDITDNLRKDFVLNSASPERIIINPSLIAVENGRVIEFNAIALDKDNEAMLTRLIYFSWNVDNTAIGTISRYGDFEAKSNGVAKVRASLQCGSVTKSAEAEVTVMPSGTYVLKKCSEADASTATKIDYVLLPDQSYETIDEFKNDIQGRYLPQLFAVIPFDANKQKFNLYYYDEKAVCNRDGSKGTKNCDLPENLAANCPFADVKAIIHKDDWRDYTRVGQYFTANNPMTQVHEMGHALFDFADEYCCDGGYFASTKYPYPNIFNNQNSCQTQLNDNSISKQCKNVCKDGDQGDPPCGSNCQCVNWYRQEGKSIMNTQWLTDRFSENNLLRITWFFANAMK